MHLPKVSYARLSISVLSPGLVWTSQPQIWTDTALDPEGIGLLRYWAIELFIALFRYRCNRCNRYNNIIIMDAIFIRTMVMEYRTHFCA
jgi:hypothetical protein